MALHQSKDPEKIIIFDLQACGSHFMNLGPSLTVEYDLDIPDMA